MADVQAHKDRYKKRPRRSSSISTTGSPLQPVMYHDPSLRVHVPHAVIRGGATGPFRKKLLERLLDRLRPKVPVKVEPLSATGMSASVLYAPPTIDPSSGFELAETSLTSGFPGGELVYRDRPFELRVAGMHAQNFDRWQLKGKGRNELLMYSMQTDPQTSGENGEGLPFIHFDHRSDAYYGIERANTFIPVPASKSFVTGSPGAASGEPEHEPKSVNVRFKIIEMDEPSETVKQAIQGIDALGGVMSEFSLAAPMVGALSPLLSVAGAVSKRALDSYAEPDKVISIDMDFLLADRARVADRTAPSGEYLRYGYYFFLSEPIEGKLYASVLTPQNVQLMLRRADDDSTAPASMRRRPVDCKSFFPLTQVSYLVVRVCEPVSDAPRRKRRPVQLSHARQLEDIFKRSGSSESPAEFKRAVRLLAQELGVLMVNSDSESEGDVASSRY